MAGILESVDQRTQLAGHNRLELLLFRFNGKQRYGINVFKVREVLECPPLRPMPNAHPAVRGLVYVRGRAFPVVDLARILGKRLPAEGGNLRLVVAEFNRTVQGFLVGSVDRIMNMRWDAIKPPPTTAGVSSYLTAVTEIEGELVEIIDVEKILAEITGVFIEVGSAIKDTDVAPHRKDLPVMVVDDSSTARKMVGKTLEQVGLKCVFAKDGQDALTQLQKMVADGKPIAEQVSLVISDIEMPVMDGYTLTSAIKRDDRLQGLFVLMHSSLSGIFNDSMVKKVGADRFLPKFSADELAKLVLEVIGPGSSKAA
jgi:two-component system chemotaxis response regulator CheV